MAKLKHQQLYVTLGDPYTIAGLQLCGWQARRGGEVVRWGNVRATTKESATRAAERSARA